MNRRSHRESFNRCGAMRVLWNSSVTIKRLAAQCLFQSLRRDGGLWNKAAYAGLAIPQMLSIAVARRAALEQQGVDLKELYTVGFQSLWRDVLLWNLPQASRGPV